MRSTVIAVPLVLLTCFVIYLAVGYGTDTRRPELAVVALRGARWWERWWLATGESLVAILLGALLGCLAGQLLVDAASIAWAREVERSAPAILKRLRPLLGKDTPASLTVREP